MKDKARFQNKRTEGIYSSSFPRLSFLASTLYIYIFMYLYVYLFAFRVNQNIASRNYRNRKKEYVTSLESKVAEVTAENDALKKEIAGLKVNKRMELSPSSPLSSPPSPVLQLLPLASSAPSASYPPTCLPYLLLLPLLTIK